MVNNNIEILFCYTFIDLYLCYCKVPFNSYSMGLWIKCTSSLNVEFYCDFLFLLDTIYWQKFQHSFHTVKEVWCGMSSSSIIILFTANQEILIYTWIWFNMLLLKAKHRQAASQLSVHVYCWRLEVKMHILYFSSTILYFLCIEHICGVEWVVLCGANICIIRSLNILTTCDIYDKISGYNDPALGYNLSSCVVCSVCSSPIYNICMWP